MLKDVDMSVTKNLFVVAAILISGIGGLKIQLPDTIQITSIATALLLGIATNAVLTLLEGSKANKTNK